MGKKKRAIRKMKRNRLFLLCLIIFLIFIVLFGIYKIFVLPHIKLKGSKHIVLNYQEKYKEKGYSAYFYNKKLTDNVKVKGKVNTKKLGTYKLVYSVKYGFLKNSVTRILVVKDKEKPKMNIDSSDAYVCPNSEIVPEKVEAKDNYDGDISKKVKHIISKDKKKITYQVTDKSGNTKKVEKKIIYKDKEAPTITLNDNETMYIYIGDEFTDPSATAKDNCDGDLTKNIKVDGTVDNNTVGEYTLTYSVKDKASNEAKVTRKIIVNEKTKENTIYLTFDDGPNDGTTNVILDILKEEGVKATFFVTNKGPDELIKREHDEGHTVALHTATHDYAYLYSSVDAYFEDLTRVQTRVKNITGEEAKIIRFPGGSSNTISRKYSPGIMTTLTSEVQNRGFKYYDWNLSSGDAAGGTPTSDMIYNNVISNLRHDRVNMVLMHDIKPYTRDALKRIIQFGKENGYRFEQITMATEMITQRVNN